ncbi:MAG: FtsH protease activity modulator HflK [Pelagibacteraceae bacterium]|jgi:membrane protease subunit HflK|nr:FtsH protease activity modulator HflK [Pelagibacteraceae bacterium]MDP6784831.1 FtsH protease activity modulator HflK [Alphaproteobacteria bacterium]MBO6468483.1 FtsH protease activity modulator HflK [Pelagibacteraceae bacterium]MBO6468686.1 FtsH protease activity modulator HflK [Pelagibacteraceae bacterium]MBO6470391.1 FtsH protease activity modulator HflK [Pelagibacteraceae bacterium]
MNWNKNNGPWGSGGNNPWGEGSSNNRDLENSIKKAKEKFGRFKLGSPRNFSFFLIVVLFIWLATGFYRVEPDEQGVELLFGKWNQTTTEPGLHIFFPTPIGKVMTPKVENIRKINVGYRSASDLGFSTSSNSERNVLEESLMLTGDQNIVDVHFTVLYKIKDAGKFLFKLRNPETTVKDMSESVMREVVGQRELEFLLTGGRQEVEQVVRSDLQDILDEYESGILVQSIQLQSVNPPALVIDAFDEVQRARQDKEKLVNEANSYLNKIVPNARGDAAKLVQEATAYKEQVIKQAEGVAQNFIDVYNSYKDAKYVTRQRIYLETLTEVLEGPNKIILDSTGEGQGVVPYLPLNELNKNKGNN